MFFSNSKTGCYTILHILHPLICLSYSLSYTLASPGLHPHASGLEVLQIDRFGWDLGKEVDGFLPVPHLQRHVLTQPEGTIRHQGTGTMFPGFMMVCDGFAENKWIDAIWPSEPTRIFYKFSNRQATIAYNC